MLLNQQPITADTNKLATFIGGYGLKIRLLNVRYEDVGLEEPVLPSREGLDDEYYCTCAFNKTWQGLNTDLYANADDIAGA